MFLFVEKYTTLPQDCLLPKIALLCISSPVCKLPAHMGVTRLRSDSIRPYLFFLLIGFSVHK